MSVPELRLRFHPGLVVAESRERDVSFKLTFHDRHLGPVSAATLPPVREGRLVSVPILGPKLYLAEIEAVPAPRQGLDDGLGGW